MMLIDVNGTGLVEVPATQSPEHGIPPLDIDGEAFIRAWHADHVHKVDGGDPECVLCGPMRSTYLLPTCRCGAALKGECDCEDTEDVSGLFAAPILWDLRGREAA